MKVLFLCQRIPFPPDRGDRIPTFQQVKRLSRTHEVVVASLAHSESTFHAQGLERELGVRVIAPGHSIARRTYEMVNAFLQRRPLSLGYFRNSRLRSLIAKETARTQFDTIIVFSSSMAQYVEEQRQLPRIMIFCDLDSQKWKDLSEKSGGLMKWIYAREYRMLLKYERRIAAEYTASCVVSSNEADLFKKQIPGIAVQVLENGVDADYFGAVPRQTGDLRIVFIGVMDYGPNVEAVSFFAERVWSRIRTRYPHAQFMIIGSSPARKVRKLACLPGVEVTGYVSDVRPYLASAALAVVPLAIARGVQNKILEAIAAGVPVLTTPVAAKGLPDGIKKHIFVAEREPEPFSAALFEMMNNRAGLEEKTAAAQDFVRRYCTWDEKLRTLDRLLEEATAPNHLLRISQILQRST